MVTPVSHATHDGTNECGPNSALDEEGEGVHVLAEAHNLEGLLHFSLSVADHFVKYEDARLLEGHWSDREKDHVAHSKPGWVIQSV